jgi:hypothetical protein
MNTLPATAAALKDEWGSDLGTPVAILGIEPDEIRRKRGIAFADGYDDLDSVSVALVKAKSGIEYALLRHLNAPKPGTEVLARAKEAQRRRCASDLVELLEYLRLEDGAITWLAPAIRSEWKALMSDPKRTRAGLRAVKRASRTSRPPARRS